MKQFSTHLIVSILLLGIGMPELRAQSSPSAGGALLRSLAIPGWGHKYANQGDWNGGAKFHTGLEATLWTGLIGSIRGESQVIQAYESWASSNANVDLEGRNRSFVLNVANYASDEDFRDALLRNRAWDQLDGVSGDDYNWKWESEEARAEFRSLRDDADSLDRRQTFFMISLIGNRLVSGFNALRFARSEKKTFSASITPILNGQKKLPSFYISGKVSF